MKTQKRAIRRAHARRMYKRTCRILISEWDRPDLIPHLAVRMYNNLTICSCMMCQNSRNNEWLKAYDRLTMQEKKALDSYNADIEEYVDKSPEMMDNEF